MTKTALIIGASGLVGTALLQGVLASPAYGLVKILVRSPLKITNLKLQTILFDFENPDAIKVQADDVYCCLGTTLKKAGSKAAFRKIDSDYPFLIARLAKLNGATRFSIVTAMGADVHSSIFYNQIKGEIERKLKELNFESLLVFRPSLLLGNRQEARFSEQVAGSLMRFFKPLIPLKYQGIEAEKVADAMIQKTLSAPSGYHVYESDVMQQY